MALAKSFHSFKTERDMFFAILSIVILAALVLVVLGEIFAAQIPALAKAYNLLKNYREKLGYWGVIYGIFAFVITVLTTYDPNNLVVRVVANALIIALALPIGFDKLIRHFPDFENNKAISSEGRGIIGTLREKAKLLAYVGAIVWCLLFVLTFS
jgi:hypothetical protein